MGRPTVITPEVEAQLLVYLAEGCTDAEACTLANISRDSFYDRKKADHEFSDKVDIAKSSLVLQAKRVVGKALKAGDKATAEWYLERKAKAEFSPRTEVTGPEGSPLGYIYNSDLKKVDGTDVLKLNEGSQQ